MDVPIKRIVDGISTRLTLVSSTNAESMIPITGNPLIVDGTDMVVPSPT